MLRAFTRTTRGPLMKGQYTLSPSGALAAAVQGRFPFSSKPTTDDHYFPPDGGDPVPFEVNGVPTDLGKIYSSGKSKVGTNPSARYRASYDRIFNKPIDDKEKIGNKSPSGDTARSFSTVSGERDFSQHRAQYEEDGYTIIRDVLDRELMEEAARHVDWLQAKYRDVPREHFHHHMMRNDPFWVRLVNDTRLLDLAQSIAPFLHDGVSLFSSHYFIKPPRTGKAVLWHQDGSYWPLRPMNVLTMWLSIDHSDAMNGCLKVVRGSHRNDLAELKTAGSDDPKNVLGSATHTDNEINPDDVVNLTLSPGDVSIHHPNIIHASDANTSDRRRCGLTIRYMSPSTACLDAKQPVMLFRGAAVPGVNSYRSWPPYREGSDFAFKGSSEWNERRFVSPEDEAFFERAPDIITEEIREEVLGFVDELGGR